MGIYPIFRQTHMGWRYWQLPGRLPGQEVTRTSCSFWPIHLWPRSHTSRSNFLLARCCLMPPEVLQQLPRAEESLQRPGPQVGSLPCHSDTCRNETWTIKSWRRSISKQTPKQNWTFQRSDLFTWKIRVDRLRLNFKLPIQPAEFYEVLPDIQQTRNGWLASLWSDSETRERERERGRKKAKLCLQ